MAALPSTCSSVLSGFTSSRRCFIQVTHLRTRRVHPHGRPRASFGLPVAERAPEKTVQCAAQRGQVDEAKGHRESEDERDTAPAVSVARKADESGKVADSLESG